MANFAYDASTREPWNNVVFPGNYVAHLNAYRKQGVTAVPGVNFFRVVGAYVIQEEDLDANGQLALGTYDVNVLSPDLRQDDKPRRDYRMSIPTGAGAYRISINTVNLTGNGSSEITVAPTPLVTAGLATPTLADDAEGAFPESGEYTEFDGLTGIVRQTSDADISVAVGGGVLDLIDKDSQAAILVEICFFLDAPAPDADDVHLPYKVEAGSGL